MPEQGNGRGLDLGKVAESARAIGDQIGTVAAQKAEGVAQRTKEAGVEAVEKASRAAGHVAESLEQDSPVVAEYVRDAAKHIDSLANGLRDRSVGDLLTMATDFGRKQPLLFFAGAALVGFSLARVMKSGAAMPSAEPGAAERNATGISV